jgi:excisionase family DNA binding protein
MSAEQQRTEETSDTHADRREPPRLSLDWWAKEIGLSRRKLNLEIAAHRLRAIRVGGRTLVKEADMDQWLDQHATMPAQERPRTKRPTG